MTAGQFDSTCLDPVSTLVNNTPGSGSAAPTCCFCSGLDFEPWSFLTCREFPYVGLTSPQSISVFNVCICPLFNQVKASFRLKSLLRERVGQEGGRERRYGENTRQPGRSTAAHGLQVESSRGTRRDCSSVLKVRVETLTGRAALTSFTADLSSAVPISSGRSAWRLFQEPGAAH